MPQARQYQSAAQRRAAYRQRRTRAHAAQLAQQSLPPLPAVWTMPGRTRWTALLRQAQWALVQVTQARNNGRKVSAASVSRNVWKLCRTCWRDW